MPGLKSLSELRGSGTRSGLGQAARLGSGGYAMRDIMTAGLIGYGNERNQSLIGSEQHTANPNLSRFFLGTLAGK